MILRCLPITHDVHRSVFRGKKQDNSFVFLCSEIQALSGHNLLHEQTLPRMSFWSSNRASPQYIELPPQKPGSLRLMAVQQNQGRLAGVDIFHTGIDYDAGSWDLNHMSGVENVTELGERS